VFLASIRLGFYFHIRCTNASHQFGGWQVVDIKILRPRCLDMGQVIVTVRFRCFCIVRMVVVLGKSQLANESENEQ
jgi:hypothetical protein